MNFWKKEKTTVRKKEKKTKTKNYSDFWPKASCREKTLPINGHKETFWANGNILYPYCGEGCTTVYVYQNLSTASWKLVNFMPTPSQKVLILISNYAVRRVEKLECIHKFKQVWLKACKRHIDHLPIFISYEN